MQNPIYDPDLNNVDNVTVLPQKVAFGSGVEYKN